MAAVGAIWIREKSPPPIGEPAEIEEDETKEEGWRGLVLIVAGIATMALGGWVAVFGAERLVGALDVAESVIGLTVVAVATTAELFALAVSAHRRGVGELAVAGVVGSAGFNSTVTLGGAALARPLDTEGLAMAAWLAAALPFLVLGLGRKKERLDRWGAAILICVYTVFVTALYR